MNVALPLTSLVPTVIEIVSFVETNWPHIWWFPNWYLGVPLRFVTGPVVPFLVLIFRRLTGVSMQTMYLGLIGLSWCLGTIGVILLVRQLGGGKRVQRLAAGLFLLLPFHLILLSYGTGLHHLAVALLPWVSVVWLQALMSGRKRYLVATLLLLAIGMLIDISMMLPATVSLLVLLFLHRRNGTVWESLFKGAAVVFTATALATIWFTPRFWWVLLGNPSFGGKPLSNVIPFVLQLVQAVAPLVLGVWVVQKRYRLKDKMMQFGVLFGVSFGFLTLIRFLSDVDFWMDWSSYFLELQLALALILAVVIKRYINKQFVILIIILLLTIVDGWVGWRIFRQDEAVRSYKQRIAAMIGENVREGERVFLSGSPVFWLGSTVNKRFLSQSTDSPSLPVFNDPGSLRGYDPGFLQVRGGRDEVSTHKTWAMGAYSIREGENAYLMYDWLTVFGAAHILVHGKNSMEYYKDYKFSDRFTRLEKVAVTEGDTLYTIQTSIGRLADKGIMEVPSPQAGNDITVLDLYTSYLKKPIAAAYITPTEIQIDTSDFDTDRFVSLAVTADPGWIVESGRGKLRSDSFGNMLVESLTDESAITLKYRDQAGNWLAGILLSFSGVILVVKSDSLARLIKLKIPSLTESSEDEEQNY